MLSLDKIVGCALVDEVVQPIGEQDGGKRRTSSDPRDAWGSRNDHAVIFSGIIDIGILF